MIAIIYTLTSSAKFKRGFRLYASSMICGRDSGFRALPALESVSMGLIG